MFMLGLNETVDQLTIANSVCWYGHVLTMVASREGHLISRLKEEGEAKEDMEKVGRGRMYEG